MSLKNKNIINQSIDYNQSGVYFLKMKLDSEIINECPNTNFIKIGECVNKENRKDDLDTGSPFPLEVVGFIPLPRDKNILRAEEKRAHSYFGHYHYKGEWYKNMENLVDDYVNLRKKDLTNQETVKEVY